MNAAGEDKTGVESIGLFAGLGYDYVEMPLTEIMQLDEGAFRQVLETLERAGIPCEACNNFFPRHMRLTGPDADHKAAIAYATQAVARAKQLGVKVIVFGSGPAKMVPPGFLHSAAHEQICHLLTSIAPIVRAAGITIAIEPLRSEECNIINTFGEGCVLADTVGQDSVNALVDYYHMTCENEEPRRVAELGKDRLVHVHFARAEGRRFPADIGEDSGYAPFVDALHAVGYAGRVSIEAYADALPEDAATALRFMREHFTR